MCPNLPIKVDAFVDLYFHQVLTLTEAANFFSTISGDEHVEGESENETISGVSLLNISTIPMSTTTSPRSIAASSPRLPRGSPRTRGGRAHQAVGPQATAHIPS